MYALPGVEFYQAIGAAIVTSDLTGGGSLAVEVLSPDLRQDDKPRLDKPLTIPAGAKVYRTAISVQNLSAAGTETVAIDGLTSASVEASLAAVGGVFPEAGAIGPELGFDFGTTQSTESSAATVTAAYSGSLNIVDKDSTAAVLWKSATTSMLVVLMLMITASLTRPKPAKAIDLLSDNQGPQLGLFFYGYTGVV